MTSPTTPIVLPQVKRRLLNGNQRVAVLAVFIVPFAIWAAVWTGWGTPVAWAVPALAAGVAVSELAIVHLAFGRQRWSFTCTDGAIGACLVLAGGSWLVVAVVLGVLTSQLIRRQAAIKIMFNVCQFSLATAAAAAVTQWNGGDMVAAFGGIGAFCLINHCLVGTAVAMTSGRRLGHMLWDGAPMAALSTAGNTSVGILAAFLWIDAPLGLLGLLVPVILLWLSYDQQTRRTAEAQLFAELACGQERAAGQSTDSSARVVVTAAARVLGGADVDLILLGADGPVRYTGDEYGVNARERVAPSVLDEEWALKALGHSGIQISSVDGRPSCTALLGDRERPLAVLHARRPEGAASFGRREITLAGVLVGQAEAWLSVADLAASRDAALDQAEAAGQTARALGDLGAHTTPTLHVLRESASRLARLAHRPAGVDDVNQIVDELHSVERAVAALLGAIALAAEPELERDLAGVDLGEAAPVTRDPEWTTTGTVPAHA